VIRESLLRLTRHSIVYGAGQAIGRGLQVLLVPILTRLFTPAEYGVLDLLAVVGAIASFFIVMGMDSALARFFYETEDETARRVMVTSSALWRLLVGGVIALLVIALAPALSQLLLGDVAYTKYVRIVALSLPLSAYVLFHNDVLRVTFQPFKFITLNLVNTLLLAGLTVLFVVLWKKQVSGALWARLAADGLTAALGFVFIRKTLIARIDRAVLTRMLRYGLPIIPAALAYWVITYADRWILVRSLDLSAVGVYAIAVKIGFVVTLFVGAFQLAWGPFAFEKARDPLAGRLYARVLTLFVGVASTIAVGMSLFAPEVLRLIVPEAYWGAAVPGALLAFGAVASGAYQITALGVSMALRTDLLAWTAFVAAAVTVALAFALVHPLGLTGVALATLAGFTVSTVLVYAWSQRLFPVPYRGTAVLALFLGGIATWWAGSSAGAVLGAQGHGAGSVAVRVALFAAFALVTALASRRTPLPGEVR
jgi:O-antigen/teichoic acid export membrane protein